MLNATFSVIFEHCALPSSFRETFQHGSSKEILPTELTIAPDHAKYVILTLMLLLAHPPNQPQTLSHLLFSRHLSSVQNCHFTNFSGGMKSWESGNLGIKRFHIFSSLTYPTLT